MSGIRDYWQNLEPRERRVFSVGGLAAALILFYTLVWDPWHGEIRAMREAVPEKFQTLIWLDQQKNMVEALRRSSSGKQASKPQSLLSYIEKTANRSRLRKNLEIVPGRGEETKVSLKAVPFDRILGFIQTLMRGGVEFKSVSFKKSIAAEGQVDVIITVTN